MRYGTIPVAHATGGLVDTITRHNPGASSDPAVAMAAAMASDLEEGAEGAEAVAYTRSHFRSI